MNLKKSVLCLFGLLLVLCPAMTTLATPITIDFGTGDAGVGGLISWLGGNNAAGINIPLDSLTVSGAPVSGVYDLAGLGSSTDPNGSAVLSFDTVQNWIKIIGGVPSLGIPNETTLLSGTFANSTVTFPIPTLLSFSGQGPDVKNELLLDSLGIDPETGFTFFGFSLSGNFNPLTRSGQAISTDFVNTAVPEPATMFLLGTGLLGLGYVGRRLKR